MVVSFAYGLPNKPFIVQVLPHGLSLPLVPKGDLLWQHSEAVQQRADAQGNWVRETDASITDRASERLVQVLENNERYQNSALEVEEHSSESVGGIKQIEALGALKLLSGGVAQLVSVDELSLATGNDLNVSVKQSYNAVIADDMNEQITGGRVSKASASQQFVAPTTWLGSEDTNVLQVLGDLIELVGLMNTAIATHKHGPTPPPDTGSAFAQQAVQAKKMQAELTAITQ